MSARKGTVHIVQRMSPGGVEVLVRDLVTQLPGDNLIFSLESTRRQLISEWPALEPYAKSIRGFSKQAGPDLGLLLNLRKTFKQLRPHAVMMHELGPLIYGGLAARLAQVPVIVQVEHNIWHYNQPRQKLLTRMAYSFVRPHIVGVSMLAADTLANITGAKEVQVISNGVDIRRFTPEAKATARARWDLPVNAPVIGVVGQLEYMKGHDVLLDALMDMPNGILCVFAGAGSQMETLKRKAETLGLENQIRFLGHLDDTSTLYSAFDVLCLPSRAEGLPLTILEAQACGVPVVASDVGSVRDAVCPEIGRVVQPEDPEALAVALLDLLRDRDQPSPRAFISENFNWSDTLAAYARLVKA